jgi:manganese/zinc/iron transport system permease protein
MFEWIDHHAPDAHEQARRTARAPEQATPLPHLRRVRSWSAGVLRRTIERAEDAGLLARTPAGIVFTHEGYVRAERLTRNHRLWELYLVTHADIAPSHVDRDADAIEHVLGPDLVRRLEALLLGDAAGRVVPQSPHALAAVDDARDAKRGAT